MNAHLEVLDAFVDGERVNSDDVKTALSDEAGRDYFVDLWKLRDAVQQDRELAAEHRTPPVTAAPAPRRSRSWLAAAALVVGVAGGYVAGHRSPLVPSPSNTQTATTPAAVVPVNAVFPAPAPTRVIQLEFHPDVSNSGGD